MHTIAKIDCPANDDEFDRWSKLSLIVKNDDFKNLICTGNVHSKLLCCGITRVSYSKPLILRSPVLFQHSHALN